MAADIEKKTWLGDLVAEALRDYDPAAALLRLPSELRGADPEGPGLEGRARALLVRSLRRKIVENRSAAVDDAFLDPIEGHIELALDIALVHGASFDTERRRAELAMLLAALTGSFDLARDTEPSSTGAIHAPAVKKAFVRAGASLKARGHPPGDPKQGLPLRIGLVCIQRRHMARLAMSYYAASQFDVAAARTLAQQASIDTVLLVEALATMAATPAVLDARRRRIALAQVERLGLPRDLARAARSAVKAPRSTAELARACPVRLRAFLLEQLMLAELAVPQPLPERAAAVQAFASEAQIPAEQVTAIQADAVALYGGYQRWLELSPSGPDDLENLASEWEQVADQMMEKVAATVTDNLEAIVTEIRQTGELGQLLAKAASGKALSANEKSKMKLALVDLAKAVPALAIFAAPGGMLLLPILAKLLPFSFLPSAWDDKEKGAKTSGRGKKAGAA